MSFQSIGQALVDLELPYVNDVPTPGDGNCFFHGIMQQLHFEENYQFASHLHLRRALVEFVAHDALLLENESYVIARNNYILNKRTANETDDAAWMRVLTEMSRDGTWIEDVFVVCMAIFLQRRIMLTSPAHNKRNPWTIFNG
jgi:hypothetical protein